MQLSLAILAVFVSAAAAAPIVKRQNFCPLQYLGGLSVTASADGKTRWDVFTVSSELIQVGDVAWFENDQPNRNEVFTATAGSAPGLFTFQSQGAQQIGVVGSSLAASNTRLPSWSPAAGATRSRAGTTSRRMGAAWRRRTERRDWPVCHVRCGELRRVAAGLLARVAGAELRHFLCRLMDEVL
ncbi:hypothetical protein B0H10DRAFT_2439922 [Mycena sp. CBHHK59/15]|nr:hypothetical protein B0H10DRAFT_2439922 [Mycena sp. CBHHK59/15]